MTAVGGDLITLASAPASGATVAIVAKDRRADEYLDFIETNDRPLLASYTTATHTLAGAGIPGNIVDAYAGGVYVGSAQVAADGTFSAVLQLFSGTQLITAVQHKPDPFHASTAVADGFGLSSTY